jgi:hypothetical protein
VKLLIVLLVQLTPILELVGDELQMIDSINDGQETHLDPPRQRAHLSPKPASHVLLPSKLQSFFCLVLIIIAMALPKGHQQEQGQCICHGRKLTIVAEANQGELSGVTA